MLSNISFLTALIMLSETSYLTSMLIYHTCNSVKEHKLIPVLPNNLPHTSFFIGAELRPLVLLILSKKAIFSMFLDTTTFLSLYNRGGEDRDV